MWALYGGAVLLSLWTVVKSTAASDPILADVSMAVLAMLIFIVAMAMAGPVFNTQLGILFWTLAAALHGARSGAIERAADEDPIEP
jgi:hypothetical protein